MTFSRFSYLNSLSRWNLKRETSYKELMEFLTYQSGTHPDQINEVWDMK